MERCKSRSNMKKDIGLRLLQVLKLQRTAFERLADGSKRITNWLLYNQCEEETYYIQRLIGVENKRRIKHED